MALPVSLFPSYPAMLFVIGACRTIVFALAPNSASCERVFALLKNLFGEQQMSALADYVQASLMLNYAGRQVG